MNVKQLKALLKKVPDDVLVLVPGEDHSYRKADANVTTALLEEGGTWTEDYGEDTTPEAEYGKRKKVLVVE